MSTADTKGPHQLRTTGEVLSRLRRLSLFVTPTMIADDTTAHYLPDRETGHHGRGGASGLWEPWMERRAERLYRLRALNRRSGGRGPAGDLLRLFLFLADGWGWEHVRDTCIKGYRLSLLAAKKGVGNRMRGQELTLENLRVFAEDIAEDQYRHQEQIDRVKLTLGLAMFGAAPDADMGTLEHIVDDLTPDIDSEQRREWKQLAPFAWASFASTETEAITILEGDLDEAILKAGIHDFRFFTWRVRYGLRRKLVKGEERPRSTNPLTAFGAAKDSRFQQALRSAPHRATPAQYIGAQVAQGIVTAYAEQRAQRAAAFFQLWFADFLKSDACARWLERMEREVKQQED